MKKLIAVYLFSSMIVLIATVSSANVISAYGCTDCFNFVAPNVTGAENVNPAEIGLIVYDSVARAFRGFSHEGKWLKLSTESSIETLSTSATLQSVTDVVFADSSGGPLIITLPSAVAINGHIVTIKKTSSDANAVSIATTSSQTIDGYNSVALVSKNDITKLISDGTNWQTLNQSGSSTPAGTVLAFSGTVTPSGYLWADGSAVSRSTYSALFAAIGTTYGSGDGSTTFNLPNTKGIFIRGAGTQAIAGVNYSSALGAVQNDQFQGHRHSFMPRAGWGAGPTDTGKFRVDINSPSVSWAIGDVGGVVTDSAFGEARIGDQTRPANISMNFLIKY